MSIYYVCMIYIVYCILCILLYFCVCVVLHQKPVASREYLFATWVPGPMDTQVEAPGDAPNKPQMVPFSPVTTWPQSTVRPSNTTQSELH